MTKYAIAIYNGDDGDLNITLHEAENELAAAIVALGNEGIDLDEEFDDWSEMVSALEEQTDHKIDFAQV